MDREPVFGDHFGGLGGHLCVVCEQEHLGGVGEAVEHA